MRKNTLGYIAIIALLAVTGFFSMKLFLREMTLSDKLDINTFPMVVDGWQGKDMPITEKEYAILETRNLISREYTNPAGGKLFLLIIYSETNRSVFHPPEVCMIGGGLTITDKQVENFDAGSKVFTTNKLFAENDRLKEIILNCYKAGDLYTSNFYLQQARLAFYQIFGSNVPGATLRVSMVIEKDQAATIATLKGFISKSAVILDKLSS
jgi:EpsI family protein